ncbi:MAG: A/G-specific adenine glycosylase [Sulfuricella sp.]|jgi:A/G-specific adenine glycosylase|nr:A/G-specific adenine glycosylase [Sulfuricella sp.]
MPDFAASLIRWQKANGRHDLPWQGGRDPYAIWLSEIMLQQTQVSSVIPYYQRFLASFPDIAALAAASQEEVLAHWSGLGYYSRARNLHRAAQWVVKRHDGIFPAEFEQILALPGVGRSTAAAISAFAFGRRHAILDGNVKRVLARYFAVEGHPGAKGVEARLWQHAEALLPRQGIEAYTQGLMDLGATVCTRTRPRCGDCPVGVGCLARHLGRQNELPGPRPRKVLPERETIMLLFLHKGGIYLEKRPPTGIWGGMWSFPEIAPADDPQQASLARFGFETRLLEPLPAMQHAFTHFRLRIRPQCLEVQGVQPQARQADGVWLGLEEALGAAIPVPVRQLLLQCGKGDAKKPAG